MSKQTTPAEAQLILQLYDLRREAELRKARDWWVTKFWPNSAEEVLKIAMSLGSQENNWLRQVGGYWNMVAALVLSGAIDTDLFLQPSISGEMVFLFAKIHPYLGELREQMKDPHLFSPVEKVINSTEFGRERLKQILARVAAMKEKMGKSA